MMKVPNEPGLSPINGLQNVFLSDQSMASNLRKGEWYQRQMLEGGPKAGSQSLDQPLVVAVEEGNGAVAVKQCQQPLGFKFSRPPADSSFKMLRQASSTPLTPDCNFNRPHQSLSLIPALSMSSLGIPLGLGGTQRTSQLSWTVPFLARSAVGPASSVTWVVRLGPSAISPAGGQTSGPMLKAH